MEPFEAHQLELAFARPGRGEPDEMDKHDFPALLAPGLHHLTLADVKAIAVDPFASDMARVALYEGLLLWTQEFQATGVGATLWLDGSFLTEKVGPSDIDCVLWLSPGRVSPASHNELSRLCDKQSVRSRFGLDLYLEFPDPDRLIHRQAYWRGFFGFCRDGVTAKGVAEAKI